MIQTPAGFQGDVRIKRYTDYYQSGYGVSMLSSGLPWSPLALFAAGEQGAWYDPSDFLSLYQDAAGTTPVTAVEQLVGLALDKSGRGNNLTQSTLNSRPTVSARVNFFIATELFGNAAWVLQGVGAGIAPVRTLNAGTSPAGKTACRLQFSLNGGTASGDQSTFRQGVTMPAGTANYSVWLRSFDGVSSYNMQLTNAAGAAVAITVTGTWQQFSASGTAGGALTNYQLRLRGAQAPVNSNTADILFSQPQIESGGAATTYQRVTTATDYDTLNFPYYLRFDGTDDFMSTSTINPGAVDKLQVWAGVRKLQDATESVLAEMGTGGQAGSFYLGAPRTAATANYGLNVGGSSLVNATSASSFAAPITTVLTGTSDISGDSALLYANTVQTGQSVSDQGTGNFQAYALYVGARAGTSLRLNGRVYSLIVRYSAANLSAADISLTNTWVNSKTNAY